MKKIMFNDKCGLTDAVLQGRKTMTRRICKEYATNLPILSRDVESFRFYPDENIVEFLMLDGTTKVSVPPYKNNEVLAVAQSYKDVYNTNEEWLISQCAANEEPVEYRFVEAGWDNKMFARAYYMPHQIKITDIKVERLQDITDEDCMEEGVMWDYDNYPTMSHKVYLINDHEAFPTPRQAFAALIDKVSGKGTWERNSWVFAYSFELVK